ncbi:Oidioi.mRNA.OKI2018_I69.XSR.g15485.t1.cds [Oikopleura dioica]|uniref:Oidioi.mRNA.OKI2018_I69.XSR.g15485.t1.cds n=1 Tax=Oikopleura dioica TaxID=34765 RepID=A0ABN7SJE0_OIKDI|nr:Oidioi.mRNA.OKI2018_I69.XSR.g15485.t1.cds [Oikopleura dioica]
MLQLRDFIPQAEEHESCRDFAKAEEIYSKGIAALDHWRLFWHRSKARMELALQSEDAESQQKHFEKALDDVKRLFKNQMAKMRAFGSPILAFKNNTKI